MALKVDTFNGDYDELRDLIVRSWHEFYKGKSTVFDYTQDYLRWNLEGPMKDTSLLVSASINGDLVGFFAGMPRNLSFYGSTPRKSSLSTFLSADQNIARKGVASSVVTELFLNGHQDYSSSFYYLDVDFAASRGLFHAHSDKHDYCRSTITNANFLAKIFDAGRLIRNDPSVTIIDKLVLPFCEGIPKIPDYDGKIREYNPQTDLDACLGLLNSYQFCVDVARVWEPEELNWQLEHPGIAHTMVYERNGKVQGLINYHIVGLQGRPDYYETIAIVDNIHWRDLEDHEQVALLDQALMRIRDDDGAVGALVLDFPYYDGREIALTKSNSKLCFQANMVRNWYGNSTMRKVGFLPWDRRQEQDFILFDNDLSDDVSTFYLDFR